MQGDLNTVCSHRYQLQIILVSLTYQIISLFQVLADPNLATVLRDVFPTFEYARPLRVEVKLLFLRVCSMV